MLDGLEKMSVGQKNLFKDICNRLLINNFIARDKKDNKEAYYFLMSFKDVFDEFFAILGLELELNTQTGAVMLCGQANSASLKLKRDESIILLILRLLYSEKLKETSLNELVICQVGDIHSKYDMLEIKKKLNKTDLVNSLRLFRRFNLLETAGDLTTSSCRIVLMPTLLLAVKCEDVNSIYQTINKIAQGGDANEEAN